MGLQNKFFLAVASAAFLFSTSAYAEIDKISGQTTSLVSEAYFWDHLSDYDRVCIAPTHNVADSQCSEDPKADEYNLTFLQGQVHISYSMRLGSSAYAYRGYHHVMWFDNDNTYDCDDFTIKFFYFPPANNTIHHVENIVINESL